MTVEKLMERLKALQEAKEQIVANYNAQLGAISECEFWLAQLTKKEQS